MSIEQLEQLFIGTIIGGFVPITIAVTGTIGSGYIKKGITPFMYTLIGYFGSIITSVIVSSIKIYLSTDSIEKSYWSGILLGSTMLISLPYITSK